MNSHLISARSIVRTEWLRKIEQIALACFRDHRVIGVTAPDSMAGASTLARAFAELSAGWGAKTLLIDLSTAAFYGELKHRWVPGVGDPKNFLEHGENGYDVLQIDPGTRTTARRDSPRHLLPELFEELEEYQSIILDLPAVLEYSAFTMSPIISALSCDTVIIVCSKARTTFDQLRKSIEILQVGGARIGGTVLNEFCPSAAEARSNSRRRNITTNIAVAHLGPRS